MNTQETKKISMAKYRHLLVQAGTSAADIKELGKKLNPGDNEVEVSGIKYVVVVE